MSQLVQSLLDASLRCDAALLIRGLGRGKAVEGYNAGSPVQLGLSIYVGQDGNIQIPVRNSQNPEAAVRPQLGELVQNGGGMVLLSSRRVGEIYALQ
jgi:hypothetical protein